MENGYIYFSIMRPVAPGTYPRPEGNKVLGICNYNKRTDITQIRGAAWGYIIYEKPLTESEMQDYELVSWNADI